MWHSGKGIRDCEDKVEFSFLPEGRPLRLVFFSLGDEGPKIYDGFRLPSVEKTGVYLVALDIPNIKCI